MASQTDPGPLTLLDAEQLLTLTGPPRGLRGEFYLQNTGDRKVVVREPRVVPVVARRGAAASAVAEGPIDATHRRARQTTRPVPIASELHPSTPPGTYHAELDVNGQQRSVVMHVTENLSLEISPAQHVLANQPGKKIKKRIVVRNDGNVPVSVPSLGMVVLDEELAHCRALRGALADVGNTMKSLDDFAVALGKRYHDLYQTLALKVQNTAVTVAPGQIEPIDLTITLSDKLDPHARYTGYAAISVYNLSFTVVPE